MFQVNSVLKSLISAFTHTQNASVESRQRCQTNFIRLHEPKDFEMIFVGIAFKLENVVPICSSFNPRPSLASVQTDDRKQFHSLKIQKPKCSILFRGEGGGGIQLMKRHVLSF